MNGNHDSCVSKLALFMKSYTRWLQLHAIEQLSPSGCGARTWRAATLMHTGAGHAPSRRPSGWRRLQDCNVALQSLLQQRDAPPSSRTPRGDKPKHCGLCMSFGLRLQLKSQNTNGTISHRASPFISALLSRSRSARVREAVTAKFAAVHTSANTAAGTAVNAARRGP